MEPEEKMEREVMAETEKKQRYDNAIDTMLTKQLELGHMPTEKDFKEDPAIDLDRLIKDLGCETFSGAIIEVVHEQRRRQGRPDRIAPLKRKELQMLKVTDPEEYNKEMMRKAEKKEEFRAKTRRINARTFEENMAKKQKDKEKQEEFRQKMTGSLELSRITSGQELEVKKVEQREMLEKSAKKKRKRWTDAEIASTVKEIIEEYGRYPTDVEISRNEIKGKPMRNKLPSPMTVRRALGDSRDDWLDSIERILDCKLDIVPKVKNTTWIKTTGPKIASASEGASFGRDCEDYRVLDFKDFSEEVKKCLQIIDDGSLVKISETVTIDVKTKICTRDVNGTKVNCYFILQTEK